VDITNTDNNGVEGLAVRLEADGTHVYVFEERKAGKVPIVLDYRLEPGPRGRLEHVRRFQLERPAGSTQTGADFRKADGRLLVADRDRGELVEIDLEACAGRDPVDCLRTADLRRLMQDHLHLETSDPGLHKLGLVEGVATDDVGALYLILDNNGEKYRDGDRSPRMIRLVPESEPAN
jgi:uncharacterized protein YjiK